jgi:hypothetical protein
MVEATSHLLEVVAAQEASAQHLSQLSLGCGGSQLLLPALEKLSEDVSLKHLLWTSQRDWAAATEAWRQAPVFGLDVADMQAQVHVLSAWCACACAQPAAPVVPAPPSRVWARWLHVHAHAGGRRQPARAPPRARAAPQRPGDQAAWPGQPLAGACGHAATVTADGTRPTACSACSLA